MKILKNKYLILLLGLQNIIQIGLVYPFHILAVVYFSLKIKFKIKTHLDLILVLYISAGIISLVLGIILAFYYNYISDVSIQFLKSFFVFMTCIVFFGVSKLTIEEFIKVSIWLFGITSLFILLSYLYLFATESFSLYQLRGQINWSTGWPQRWVMFAIIAHFMFYSKYHYSKYKIDLLMALITLSIILLGGTRSALLSLVVGHIIFSFFTKKDFVRFLILLFVSGITVFIYWSEFSDAFRIASTLNYFNSEVENTSSLGYRLNSLWPALIGSLDSSRILFGWGHIGAASIPNLGFNTSESQYIDVIIRQGIIGIVLYLSVLFTGIYYAYKLYKIDKNINTIWIWKASVVWQVAMLFQGITVETVRYSLYGLFYFLFLGILSTYYYKRKRNND